MPEHSHTYILGEAATKITNQDGRTSYKLHSTKIEDS
jgi:hypothetical protein